MRKIQTQTVIVLPELDILLAALMCDVPNEEGFRLLGIMPNGLALSLVVCKDANGCHYLADQNNSHRLPSVFKGWVKDKHS